MASRQTRVIGGNGTSVQSFELAPGILQYVQSVLVEVDTTASADTTPVLTVKTQNDVPVVDVPQGRSVAAGGARRASWALGLDAEQEPATDPFLPVLSVFVSMQGGQVIANNTLGVVSFTSVKYVNGAWGNLATPFTTLTVPTTGYYTVWGQFEWNIAGAAGQRRQAAISLTGDPFLNGLVARLEIPTINAVPTSQDVSMTRRLVAGTTIQAIAFQNSGGNFTLGSCYFAVTRVWKG